MAARSNRALFLMDLGVPRNIDAAAADLYNLYVYNIDDLTEIVEQNRNARESEVPRAEVIVEEHVGKFLSWQASVELVGLVDALRSRIREERAAFIRARLEGMSHLAPRDREHVETLMDELLEKLLVEPAVRLRGEKELRRKIQNVEAIYSCPERTSREAPPHWHSWQPSCQMASRVRSQASFFRRWRRSRNRHHQNGWRQIRQRPSYPNRRQRYFCEGA
jgi:glutamyl-tRNA reductase